MPGGDGTGPIGMGPMTGRAAGYCAGYPAPGYMNSVPGAFGYGFGRGGWGRGRGGFARGAGRGRKNWYYVTGMPGWMRANYGYPAFGGQVYPSYAPQYAPQFTANEERDMLKEEADFLKQQLKDIQSRISTLEKAQAQETG